MRGIEVVFYTIVFFIFIILTEMFEFHQNFKHMGIHEDTDEVVLCSRDDLDTINILKHGAISVTHNTTSANNPPITNKTSSSTVAGRTSNNNSDHQTTETSKITTFAQLFNTVGNKIALFDGEAEIVYMGYRRDSFNLGDTIDVVFIFAVTNETQKYIYTIGKSYKTYIKSDFLGNNLQKVNTTTPSEDTQILNMNTDPLSQEIPVNTATTGKDGTLNSDVVTATSISDKNATMVPISFTITRTDSNNNAKTTTLYATVPVALKTLNYNASAYTPPLS